MMLPKMYIIQDLSESSEKLSSDNEFVPEPDSDIETELEGPTNNITENSLELCMSNKKKNHPPPRIHQKIESLKICPYHHNYKNYGNNFFFVCGKAQRNIARHFKVHENKDAKIAQARERNCFRHCEIKATSCTTTMS